MKSLGFRFLALIMAFLLAWGLISCAGEPIGNGDNTGNSNVPGTTTEPSNVGEFIPSVAYSIVRGAKATDAEMLDAVEYLQRAFLAVYGLECDEVSDAANGGVPAEYEILVGETNRAQSAELSADLLVDDYLYFVESEKTIVICGGSPAATLEATKKFCKDVLGYTGFVSAPAATVIQVGATDSYRADYPCSNATLNGVDLSAYTVAYTMVYMRSYAMQIAHHLGSYTGETLNVVACSALTGNESGVICVGSDNRTAVPLKKPTNGYLLNNYTDAKGVSLCVLAANLQDYSTAVEAFCDSIEADFGGTDGVLTVARGETVCYFPEITAWELKEETTEELCKGVTYTKQYYTDEKNLSYRAYVLTVDPEHAYLYMGTANDAYDRTVETANRQNVMEHMQSAAAKGTVAIAGVNADFFAMQTDYSPIGLAIKEGTLISGANGKPFFGFTNDGRAMIGKASDHTASLDLRTAVGGSALILTNGQPEENISAEDIHPRTVVGITEDGKIVIAVIDGRQAAVSNGATLGHCALLLMSFGAVNGINLDGGGSSTLITYDGNTYTTENSPSDGKLRDVYNSLLIVPKA